MRKTISERNESALTRFTLTDEVGVGVAGLVLKAKEVAEVAWRDVDFDLFAVLAVDSFVTALVLLNLFDDARLLQFCHFAHNLAFEGYLGRSSLVRRLIDLISFAHPRMSPDLLQGGSLFVVVGHHIEDQVFELLGVRVVLRR